MSIVAKRLDGSRWHLAWDGSWSRPHCARRGTSYPPPKRDRALQFSAHFYCRQTAGWIKVVPINYGGRPQPRRLCVRWGPSFPSPKRAQSPQFSANVRCGQTTGWTKMALGMGVGLGPGHFVFDGDPATPRTERTPTTTQFLVHVYCGQTAGWTKTPVGTEVDLSPGHIVLDGVPALRERGIAAPIFSARVYCGHGRPSQLLLSSCYINYV